MITVQYLLVLVFLICSILSGVYLEQPIGCYLCNTYTDPDSTACLDPMTPYPVVNTTVCSVEYVCTRVSYITNKVLVVSRGCDPSGDTCNSIYQTLIAYYPDLSNFNCYTCSTNWCNDISGVTENGSSKILNTKP